jgi:hypothetical protein
MEPKAEGYKVVTQFRFEGQIAGVERTTGAQKWVVVRSPRTGRVYVVVVPREVVKGLRFGTDVLVEGKWDEYAQVHDAVIMAKLV